MSEDLEGSPKDFQEVKDPAEAEGLFHEALRARAPVTIWTQNQKHRIQTRLNPGFPGNGDFSAQIPEGFKPVLFTRELKAGNISECYFSVALSRASIFFKTTYVGFNPQGLHFRNPGTLYKVQRRKDLRVPIRSGVILRVQFWSPADPEARLTHRVHDLSASGLSFIADAEEMKLFKLDLPLQEMTLELNGRTIVTDGLIRHTQTLEPGKSYKVGVAFRRMKAAETQHIAKYVLEENIRRISRFL